MSKLLLCTSCLRTLGVSINPHSYLGKIGYGLAIVLIITILVIILLAL
ncbi:hypothetical protein MK516_01340 [Streptococcus gallolyticus subsp. gallolyticus]|nr:hypothetical protein [Streptococcus gallolyticus]MCY7171161.1 hypothetical protein [Streptococcus gallolyticus subsp. gallolyticus]